MIRILRPNIALAIALCALVLVVVVSGAGLRDKQRALEDAAVEDLFWTAAQVDIELQRFIATAAQFAAGDPGATADDVRRRFDILWSRAALLRDGEVAERLVAVDGVAPALAALGAALAKCDPVVQALDAADGAKALRVVRAFRAVTPDVRRLATAVLVAEGARHQSIRQSLKEAWISTLVTLAGSFVIGLGLVGASLVGARRAKRAAALAEVAATRARAANEAKSRFLAVMSHDLRTPLNGLLGQVSLVRDGPLSSEERVLLDNALSAGAQLGDTLSEILAFSEIERAGRGRVSQFSVAQLADGLQAADLSWADAERVEIDADEKLFIEGRKEHLLSIGRLFLRWARAVSPQKRARLRIAAAAEDARGATLVFTVHAPDRKAALVGGACPLDAISQGVGCARSLMELLRAAADGVNAEIVAEGCENGGVCVELAVPIRLTPMRAARLAVRCETAAVAALLTSLARKAGMDVVDDTQLADFVLWDGSGERPEDAKLGSVSETIGIGPRPQRCSTVFETPLDPKKITEFLRARNRRALSSAGSPA